MKELNYTFNVQFQEQVQVPPFYPLLTEKFSVDDETVFVFHTDAYMIFNQERLYNTLGDSTAEVALKTLTQVNSNTISEDLLPKDVNQFDIVRSRHAQSSSELMKYATTLANITDKVIETKKRYIETEKRNQEYQKSVDDFRNHLRNKE